MINSNKTRTGQMANKRYPADFIARVKAEYPLHKTTKRLHEFLDSHSYYVKEHIDGSGQQGFLMSPIEVARELENGHQAELLERAKKLSIRMALYGEWRSFSMRRPDVYFLA